MATDKTPVGPQPNGLNANVTHGDTLLKRAVHMLSTRALDGRSRLALDIKEEKRELIAALGGPSEVSPQEMAIVEMIAMKRIRRKPIAEWCLMNRDKLFDRRKRALAPITLQLEQMEESEVRLLKELGLKRRAKQMVALSDYLEVKRNPPTAPGKAPVPTTATENPPGEGPDAA